MTRQEAERIERAARLEGPYRYTLLRKWDDRKRLCLFVMLNPSTADHEKDDPTIRRCIDFADRWGYGGILVGNLFAYRATDPRGLSAVGDAAVGPQNDAVLAGLANCAGLVIAAWGSYGWLGARDCIVLPLLERAHDGTIYTLGLTKHGHPRHPLYVRATTQPVKFG